MPPLGYIEPKDRTNDQNDAHAAACAKMVAFTLPPRTLAKGEKVMLTDFWKHPDVVADVGQEFTGFHQLTGSCFPAGTPVRLSDGTEKPIENIKSGDWVVTHTGNVRYVTQTMRREYSGEMVKIHVSGFPFPLEMTADHQVAIQDGDGILWKCAEDIQEDDRVFIGWDRRAPMEDRTLDTAALLGDQCIILDELMKDEAYTKGNEPDVPNVNVGSARLMVKRNGIDWRGKVRLHHSRVENSINRYVPVCPSLARFIGIYLAEGGTDEGRVVFTFHARERETLAAEVIALARGLFGAEGEFEDRPNHPNTVKVRFQNVNLAGVLKALVPGNVYTKRVPGLFFAANEETRLALFMGWMSGDGYVAVKGGKNPGNIRITGVTVCAGLARDMTTIALSCGMRATCILRKARKQSKVSYSVDLAGKKAVSLFPAVAHRANGPRYKDGDPHATSYGFARSVRRIERRAVENLPVFDFEVAGDHSFIAGGIVVHNCVGASAGNAIFTLAAIQRLLSNNPTKAFIPWWPFPYGRTRWNEGDRGQGEGAVDSVMGQTLIKEGVFGIDEIPDEPGFKTDDGFYLTSKIELTYSDGNYSGNTKYMTLAKQHPVGSAAPLSSPADIQNAIINGYPVLDGCAYYVGNGSVKGSGADAYVVGHYDGRGGHSTCFLGAWNHPNDGPLYLYSNQWPTSTYPKDPAGAGRCCCWMTEAEVQKLFSRYGGDNGETMALSHLSYFASQADKILSFVNI